MPDAITQGQFIRFLKRNNFVPKGKNKNRFAGIFNGIPHVITFHYHKDNDPIPTGTLSAIAEQLKMSRQELIYMIKKR